jgi:hypothetical protein
LALCNSIKAIEERKSIDEARKEEKQFFENHPVYRHLAEKMGTIQLQRVLNQVACLLYTAF